MATTTTTTTDDELERMLQTITSDLPQQYSRMLLKIHRKDALTIIDYMISLNSEANPAVSYRKSIIKCLTGFIAFSRHIIDIKQLERKDVLAFLDSKRKSETADPLHKWIGTYNLYRSHLLRFFKWLHYPDIEPYKRPKPSVVQNIQLLNRKEKSIYKSTDLWTSEDDKIFVKYCPSKRIQCFHMMAKDTSCRPHELLKLRIKDVSFKITHDKYQYAEVVVNGKTGSRHSLLVDSIPYLKDYLDHEHPQPANPNAILICGYSQTKSFGRAIDVTTLDAIYGRYKNELFPKLLDSPNVLPEDKLLIKELLKKLWNPYILRHSSLTEKSKVLREPVLREHAGWSKVSDMPQIYLHYFGNESNQSLLEAYGVVTKDQQQLNQLRPKPCPNCSEPNKPDARFCAKCRMVLNYDAYNETMENQKEKESKIEVLEDQVLKLTNLVENLCHNFLFKVPTSLEKSVMDEGRTPTAEELEIIKK